MNRAKLLCTSVVVLFVLGACAEKEQTAQTRKTDAEPWTSSQSATIASGWTSGDKASWEEQLRKRAQAQNEYNRTQ